MADTKKQVDMLFEVAKLTMQNHSQKTIASILGCDLSIIQALQGEIRQGTKYKSAHYIGVIASIEKRCLKKARLISKMFKDGFCITDESKKLNILKAALLEKTDQFLKQAN